MNEPYWTLEDHLRHGRFEIREIIGHAAEEVSGPRVCFHLYPLTSDDDESWGMDAGYCQRAKQDFQIRDHDFDVDYVGGHCGIEVWQEVMPTEDWLMEAVPLVWDIATRANMFLAGWSFEPRNGPYISVGQTVNVYNGNNLRELPPPPAARSFRRLSDWLGRQLGWCKGVEGR